MCSVRRGKRGDGPNPAMGYGRPLDTQVRVGVEAQSFLFHCGNDVDHRVQISQRMGVLGVQCRAWVFSGSVLRTLTDDDGGALSARFRQHGASHISLLSNGL